MEYLKLCDSDYRFMMVVWEHAPVSSGTLVKLCNEVLGWKKSTTYTTIKKLSEKGYIKNENAMLFSSSVYHILPCVPFPFVCISAYTTVPLGAALFSISLHISFCVESISL